MPRALIYWILMLLWLVLGGIDVWRSGWTAAPVNLILFILLLLIGLSLFGAPVKG